MSAEQPPADHGKLTRVADDNGKRAQGHQVLPGPRIALGLRRTLLICRILNGERGGGAAGRGAGGAAAYARTQAVHTLGTISKGEPVEECLGLGWHSAATVAAVWEGEGGI